MKKFLLRCTLFVICFITLYPAIIFISAEFFPPWLRPNVQYFRNGDGYMLQRLREADRTTDIDILFLGSSHTYQAYNPEYFPRYRIMNLGSSNQTHVQTAFLTERYINQLNPDLVIYEVNPNMLNNDDTESSIDIISNSELTTGHWKLAHRDNIFRILNTILYKWIKERIFPDRPEPPSRNDALGDRYISAGFVMKNKDNNAVFDTEKFIYIPPNTNGRSLNAFHETVSLIREKGINLILVYTPVTSGFYRHSGQEEKIEDILFSYPAVPYYNFNELFSWNDTTDFYDEHHLNRNGVRTYNEMINRIADSALKNRNTVYSNR